MKTIGIIGGGFAGMMTAVQLLWHARCPLHIIIINPKKTMARGTASAPIPRATC